MKLLFATIFLLTTPALYSQNSDNPQSRILSNPQVEEFLQDSKVLRSIAGIFQTDCETAKCSYKNNAFENLGAILKNVFPNLIIKNRNHILMDLYSPDEKFSLLFGGDEFDQKKNNGQKDAIEEFFSNQIFSYIFCIQKFNPVYDFEGKVFSFRIFENIHSERDEYLKSDVVEIPVPEEKAEKIRKNFQKNAIVCKFKLDTQTKTETHGAGLIYQTTDVDCGIWEASEDKFYFKEEEKPAK